MNKALKNPDMLRKVTWCNSRFTYDGYKPVSGDIILDTALTLLDENERLKQEVAYYWEMYEEGARK